MNRIDSVVGLICSIFKFNALKWRSNIVCLKIHVIFEWAKKQ